jgi:hypothetical protein
MATTPTYDLAFVVTQLTTSLARGNAVLFLGAGASMEGKGPSGQELTERLLVDFPYSSPSSRDLLEVCQDIVDTPPYTSDQLAERVRFHLTGVGATQSHLRAARLPWAAIFTTNYDDAVEKAFDHKDCGRTCAVHFLEDRTLLFPNRTTTPVFKIMGCIRRRTSEPGEMVLTRGQYNSLAHFRHRSLDALYDALKGGTLVFVGYSFADRLVFDALDQLTITYGLSRIPWSYCIGPNPPSPTDLKGRHQLERRRIIPIEGTFSQLMASLWPAVRSEKFAKPPEPKTAEVIQLSDCRIVVDSQDLVVRTDAFTLLTDQELAREHGTQDDFFEGKDVGWTPYHKNWDFRRRALPKHDAARISLADRIVQLCTERSAPAGATCVLLGGPGTGKSTFLRRIAFDVHEQGMCPVLMLNMRALRVDFAQVHALLTSIAASAMKDFGVAKKLPTLILVDNAGTQIKQLIKLRSYLNSKGHKCVFLAAEREGEWNYATRDIDVDSIRFESYSLSAEFDDEERERIISHLCDLGYLRVRGESATRLIRDSLSDSLFATFYSFVHPSRIPLNRIVEQQFTNLPSLQREAFSLLCLLAQHGLDMPFELLVRAIDTDFTSFHTEVLSGAAAAVIYEDCDENGQLCYRPHHRIIAEKTVSRFLSEEEEQFRLYRRLFSHVNLSNPGDWKIMTRLVVDVIGPNASRSPLSGAHLRELLDTLIERGAGRSILHHRGLVELREGKYEVGETFLKRALADRQRFDESYRSESDQNILTSLGTLYSAWGIDLRHQGQVGQSDRLLEEAARCFVDARGGRFGSPHSYHAHAIMLRNKARIERDSLAAANYISEALVILEEAKEELEEESLLPIHELEGELLVASGDPAVSEEVARQLAEDFGSSAGFAVWANCEVRRLPPDGDRHFEEMAIKVERICNDGLAVNAADYRILRALAYLYRRWGFKKREERYDVLLRLSSCYPRFSPQTVYELGALAFALGRFKDAMARFEELRVQSETKDVRIRPREFVQDAMGGKKVFKGFVFDIAEGRGLVSCSDFRDPYFRVFFNPRYVDSSLSRNDGVVFHIHFNRRGPYAREIYRA